MTECIYFESVFQIQDSRQQHVVKTQSDKEWEIEEIWSVGDYEMIQEICVKKRDYFESNYYVDLEVFPVTNESDAKICKSARMNSSNIKFTISGNEYSRFGRDFVTAFVHPKIKWKRSQDPLQNELTLTEIYRYKVTLAPIFPFLNVQIPFKKLPKKRTKIELLEGLKNLSRDIGTMFNNSDFSDVVLFCGKQELKAHRNILSARSYLFKELFHKISENTEMVENNFEGFYVQITFDLQTTSSNRILKIYPKNIFPEDFKDFIAFIYTGRSEILSYPSSEKKIKWRLERAKTLYVTACIYGVHDLQKKCLLKLKSEVSEGTRLGIYIFAFIQRCEELQNHVLHNITPRIIHNRMEDREERIWMGILRHHHQNRYEHIQREMGKYRLTSVLSPNENSGTNDIENGDMNDIENSETNNIYISEIINEYVDIDYPDFAFWQEMEDT